MKLKRILFIVIILQIMGYTQLHADKKPRPIPLEILSDPSSGSYVPYPYPKTDYEIIEDFRFAIENLWGEKSKSKSVVIGEDPSEIMVNFTGDNPSLEVTQIIKVKDLLATSPSRHYYLLQIEDENGKPVATGIVQDSGLLGGVSFLTEGSKYKPFKTKPQVKKMLREAVGYSIIIDEIERVLLPSSICTDDRPLWRIKTPHGIFFIDNFDNAYGIETEFLWDMKKHGHPDPSHRAIVILDQLEGKAIFLKKIKKIKR